ncbi:hypothetical protein BD410DRAFT_318450 [Rickenella mellea]|uniref:Mid2 domain-containing protein n=1 Tax=Rickenella mellea TaxID=50990 RepID=A0A4Y7Q0G7_9AGAM|nr:hypothetical protein BD410DRAFT_318450 [Rickenella mellea]
MISPRSRAALLFWIAASVTGLVPDVEAQVLGQAGITLGVLPEIPINEMQPLESTGMPPLLSSPMLQVNPAISLSNETAPVLPSNATTSHVEFFSHDIAIPAKRSLSDWITSTVTMDSGPTSYIPFIMFPRPTNIHPSKDIAQPENDALENPFRARLSGWAIVGAIAIALASVIIFPALAALIYAYRSGKRLDLTTWSIVQNTTHRNRWSDTQRKPAEKSCSYSTTGSMGGDNGEWLEEWRKAKEHHLKVNRGGDAPVLSFGHALPLPPLDLEAGLQSVESK